MNNKAILVVSFGTSHLDTLDKTIKTIEERIKVSYPDYKIYRAFTSKMIIRKLRNDNILHVNTVSEAMQEMISDGISELIVQPTHIINGLENDLMIADINKYVNNFSSVKISTPLLTDTKDYFKVVDIISSLYPSDSKNALVLMGHGTSHYSNCAYPALDYYFKNKQNPDVYVGTVEGYPELDDVLEKLKEKAYKSVSLVPFMLVAGDHAKNDMAGDDEDSWKTILTNNGFNVNTIVKGLGEIKGIQDIYLEHLSKCFL